MDRRLHGAMRSRTTRLPARLPGGPRRWIIGAVVVLALAGALTGWAVWRDGDDRARVYTDATACLLTPAAGVADPQAAPVWAGMQEASLATRGKVQYLEVDGPQTGAQAATFLATLAGSGCDLVLTVGAAPNAALTDSARSYPKTPFVMVGPGEKQSNVSVVDDIAPEAVRAQVSAVVTAALEDGRSG